MRSLGILHSFGFSNTAFQNLKLELTISATMIVDVANRAEFSNLVVIILQLSTF